MEIIGTIYKIENEVKDTKSGQLQVRNVILRQKRIDETTDEVRYNFPAIEFSGKNAALVDGMALGQKVKITFALTGVMFTDKKTGAERNFTSTRGYKIEPYAAKTQQSPFSTPAPQQQPEQTRPQGYQNYAQQPAGDAAGTTEGNSYQGNEFFDSMRPAKEDAF